MSSDHLFPDEPDDTRIEILAATYEALVDHGYADLTIERIGEQFPKSTSLIYHHYDGKDELLLDFLTYLLEDFDTEPGSDGNPEERLTDLLDHALSSTTEEDAAAFRDAIVELRAQGANDDAYRRKFSDHDDFFREGIETIIADGIDAGVFQDVDPAAVATTIHALVTGVMVQEATATSFDPSAVRNEIDAYVESHVLADGR